MLFPTNKERSIPSLNIDWDAMQKEVEAINNAKNIKPSRPPQLAKQTSGNLYKQQSVVKFLEEGYIPDQETKTEERIAPEAAKKIQSKFSPESYLSHSSNIRSARTGGISNDRGPSKYIKSESSNSIWDNERLARLAGAPDPTKEGEAEKEAIQNNRRHAEKQRMDSMVEALQKTDQRKDSYVSSLSARAGNPYKTQQTGMSIFAKDNDFGNIPEKTEGEATIERSNTERAESKEDPIIVSSKAVSSKDIVSRMFDSLVGNAE